MLDIQQKRKVRSVMYHRVTLALLSVLVLVVAHSTWAVWRKKSDSEEMKSVSLANVKELEARDRELKLRIERLETVAGIEEEIRSKFSVVKESENMVVIVDEANSPTSTVKSSHGFWQVVKNFFSGR